MNSFACQSLALLLAIFQVVAAASSKAKKPKKSKSKSKLSIGVIIAIVIVAILLLIAGVAVFCIFRCLRGKRKSSFPLKTQGVPDFASGGKSSDPEQVSFLHPPSNANEYSAPAPAPPAQYEQASWRQDAPPPPPPPPAQYDQASWRPDAPQSPYNSGPSPQPQYNSGSSPQHQYDSGPPSQPQYNSGPSFPGPY